MNRWLGGCWNSKGSFARIAALLAIVLMNGLGVNAQRTHPGRGAISTQDLTKLTTPTATGSDAADQVCARSAKGSVVTDPPVLQSRNGVLEVTMGFYTATDAQGLMRYCYVTNTGLEAPTLVVNPGDALIIHFTNNLPAAGAGSTSANMAGMHMTLSSSDASSNSPCNGAMGANVTNIHFHGTNIAPVCGQDEVIHTLVQPGQSFDYKVLIPSNEPPGLYWYHPHPHGISEGQVQGGGTGALIVEGLQNVNPAVAGLPERTFVIRDQLLPASEANDTNIPAWDLSINYVPVTYPGYTPAVIQTNPGQQELWRIANTAADTILNLQYTVNGVAQPMQVVGMDGYPIAAGGSGQSSVSQTSILLGPGARAEFIVTTPAVGQQGQLSTQYWNTGPDGDFDPARPIANIVSQADVEDTAPPRMQTVRRMPLHTATRKITRFASLASLTPAAQRTLYFSEVLQNPADPDSPTTFYITQEGQTPAIFTMDQQPNIVVHAGTVEDWTVQNRAGEDHIFHTHQLHFQVLEINDQPVNDPALRDTVDVPYWSGSGPYPSVKVRMDFSDPSIVGTFVYHCHILEHEDGGMMGEIQVLAPGSASTTTVSASTASTVPNGNVTLTANVVDASSGDAAPTGAVQFQLNGDNVGNPVVIVDGQATYTGPINGNTGSNALTALYEGDQTYTESTSAAIPITLSSFGLTSAGASVNVGAAALANVTVNVADNYTTPINLTCTLPSGLKESACFVNPSSITGTGQVQLTVNSTPAHPLNTRLGGMPPWLLGSGGAGLACAALFFFPRGRWRNVWISTLAILAIALPVLGCGGATRTDSGTAKGTYFVVVTASSGSGATAYQTSVKAPIILQ